VRGRNSARPWARIQTAVPAEDATVICYLPMAARLHLGHLQCGARLCSEFHQGLATRRCMRLRASPRQLMDAARQPVNRVQSGAGQICRMSQSGKIDGTLRLPMVPVTEPTRPRCEAPWCMPAYQLKRRPCESRRATSKGRLAEAEGISRNSPEGQRREPGGRCHHPAGVRAS